MTRKQAIIAFAISSLGLIFSIIAIKNFFLFSGRKRRSLEEFREHVSVISELIIPRTDTPGAKDAAVPDFIIRTLKNCYSRRDRSNFLAGLERLEEYSIRHFSGSFLNCSFDNKTKILEYFEKEGPFSNSFLNKVKSKILGPSFFEIIKKLTITGYCTSMIGATRGLAYDKVPVVYLACEPYVPKQKSWAMK